MVREQSRDQAGWNKMNALGCRVDIAVIVNLEKEESYSECGKMTCDT
jgi:hypothetical protein